MTRQVHAATTGKLQAQTKILRLARAAMGQPEIKVADLCTELGITRQRSTGSSGRKAN